MYHLTGKNKRTRRRPDCCPAFLMTDNWGVESFTWPVDAESAAGDARGFEVSNGVDMLDKGAV